MFLEPKTAKCYQKMLDRISDRAWIMDETGQLHLVNRVWRNNMRSRSRTKLNFFWSEISPEQRESIEQQWQKRDFDRNVWQQKIQLTNARNEYQLFEVNIEQLSWGDRQSLWLGTASEIDASPSLSSSTQAKIADYKQKEIQLQRNVEFVRRIMESSRDCIKVMDLEGRLLYMNDGGQDIMEIDDFTTVQNAPWLSFWQGCHRSAAEQAFATAKAGDTGRFDGYCATAKGTLKWWEVIVTPILDDRGRVAEILSVSREITARKTAEQALEKRNQELDHFTYVVTHDLKAPLRGILNLSQWIVEDLGEQSAETKHQLNLLQQRVRRMNALIDGLLKYSTLGKQELPIESVDVSELLEEVVDSLSPPKDFKIINTTKLPILQTKRLLLTQVLSNLISNSLKHHDRDRGKISVAVEDRGTHYEFAIADDGPGIEESQRQRIFKIFHTVNNNSSSTNTGIGLALVKKIVTEEGGRLWLEDHQDRGSKFCFTWSNSTI